jgi:RNase P subunit RPR2
MCERHTELLTAYQKAVALFSTTLDALQAARANVAKDEYDRMRNYVEQTRMISENARIDLERHVAEHGCGSLANGVG